MGGNRREAHGRRRHQGLQCHYGDPGGGGKTVRRSRLRDFAGVAGGKFRRRTRLPDQRSRKTVRAYLLYRAVEHGGKSGHRDQRRLWRERISDRRADRRPPLRRHWRAGNGEGIRGLARSAKAVAEPAEELMKDGLSSCEPITLATHG